MNRLDFVDQTSLRDDIPAFGPGDTINVHVKVIEGAKERIQVFKGVVIRRQGGGIRETFTVRKESYGVGVERTFPVHSPNIDHIEVVTRGDVRRAIVRCHRGCVRCGTIGRSRPGRRATAWAAGRVPATLAAETPRCPVPSPSPSP